ncbi:MAG: winged helix-turn-helix transcriptional regulator [Verrucomicrobiales bacterium]|nr:winged helix-turn-helix transcriptional regulator [Verrucomicrobiales bacterium]MCP5559988.1 winged helix-turn-helix transcriptional regulator [Verrucomicrobiaceae bacterium]
MNSPLEGIVGNATAERVLLHLYHYGEIHASAIAADFGMAVSQVVRQLERFERAGLVVAKLVGRSRLYQFDPRSPVATALKELVRVVYEGIPLRERQQIFAARRRPRLKGKPVIVSDD